MSASPLLVQKVCQELTASGRLVEAGFDALRSLVIPAHATPNQVAAMRVAFFSGASLVFDALMAGLDDGEEATDADLQRMSALQAELSKFQAEFAQAVTTRGTA